MSDRLSELLRQRAAIQAHLDWLDREIVQVHSENKTTPAPLAQNAALTPAPAPVSHAATSLPDPDTILAGYRQDPQNLRTDIRKGCLLYFFGAFILLGLGLTAFYFVNRLIHDTSSSTPPEQHAAPVER